MTDNIKPEHYRTGEIDLFEEWYLTYPFEQYRAIMQSHAEKYLRRNKVNRVEDLDKCVETIRRLKEKEIEHREKQEKVKSKDEVIDDAIAFANHFGKEKNRKTPEEAFDDMREVFAKMGGVFSNFDASENIHNPNQPVRVFFLKNLLDRGFEYLAKDVDDELWAYDIHPRKSDTLWIEGDGGDCLKVLDSYNFPEVKWSDEEPTEISELLESYENGGENGK